MLYLFLMKTILTTKIKETIMNLATQETDIVAAYLFGSYAYGKPSNTSDIDLGFLVASKQNISIVAFSTTIARVLPQNEVDVVIDDVTDKPLLLMEIIKGKLVYEKSTDKRVTLETRILKLYDDYLHLNRIKSYYLNKSFSEGIYAVK